MGLRARLAIVGALVLVVTAERYMWYWGSEETRVCTVTATDMSVQPETGKRTYWVFTEECDVLHIEDVLMRGQVDAASAYNEIEPDTEYEFTTVGWRFPVLSQFPVVIDFVETGGQGGA